MMRMRVRMSECISLDDWSCGGVLFASVGHGTEEF